MAQIITKDEINAFSLVGKLIENPTKGILKDKIYCEMKIKTTRIKDTLEIRSYGLLADEIPTRYFQDDIILIKGQFIQTANGIELVAQKIKKLKIAGEFGTALDDFLKTVNLYSPQKIEERRVKKNEPKSK